VFEVDELDFEVGDLYSWFLEPGKQRFSIPDAQHCVDLDRGQVVELRDFLNKVLDKMPIEGY
jgi:hypothetical protein